MRRRPHLRVVALLLGLTWPALVSAQSAAPEESTVSGLGASRRVHANLVIPDGSGPFPAVLVLHTSGGVDPVDLQFARRLAEQGYAAIVPDYWSAYGLSYMTRRQATTRYAEALFNDFTEIAGYLKAHPRIRAPRVGAVGFSMGGYWAVILAGKKIVQAGVSYYGALSGGPGGMTAEVRYQYSDVFSRDSAPVLIMHGSADSTVSVEWALTLASVLRGRGSAYELQIYRGAEHTWDRGRTRDSAVEQVSWQRTLAFLNRYLKE